MNCPRCDEEIDFASQMKEMQEKFWCDASFGPAVCMIECRSEKCSDEPYIMMLEVTPTEDFEEIDSPIGKVRIPKV
jgi:hypothetical protein